MNKPTHKGALVALLSAFWLASACGSSSGSGLFGGTGRPCATSVDCDRDAPICGSRGVCVECVANNDCGGGDVCDAIAGLCSKLCATAADCPSNGVCAARGVCVACATNADCTARSGQICNAAVGQCVGCRSDLDCAGAQRFCDAASAVCEACRVSADCAANQTCRAGDCVTHCASSADCGNGAPVCLLDSGACVECVSDADCSASKPGCVLSEHRCRDCSSDAQCMDGKQCDIAKGQCQ